MYVCIRVRYIQREVRQAYIYTYMYIRSVCECTMFFTNLDIRARATLFNTRFQLLARSIRQSELATYPAFYTYYESAAGNARILHSD